MGLETAHSKSFPPSANGLKVLATTIDDVNGKTKDTVATGQTLITGVAGSGLEHIFEAANRPAKSDGSGHILLQPLHLGRSNYPLRTRNSKKRILREFPCGAG